MKKYIIVAMLILLAACSGGQTPAEYKDLAAADMAKTLAETEGVRILDIRTPPEYQAGHMQGAVNIDFYGADFRQRLSPLDKDVTYVVYCRSGNRSAQAMSIFNELGFKKILHLKNGIKEWVARGLPLVR